MRKIRSLKSKIKNKKYERKILLLILIISLLNISFIQHCLNMKMEQKNIITNEESFYDNILNLINTKSKYKGAKICYYNYNEDKCIYKYLCPKKVLNKKLKLYGSKGDGGYLLTDGLDGIKIVYSFGINQEFSFELKMADNNIESYMYDIAVNKLKFEVYNYSNEIFTHDITYYQKKLHFFNLGLEGIKTNNDKMKTLEELLITNGHMNEKNMILKMDIEDAEWDVFF